MKREGQWIEAFRVGTHTDSAGNVREWTEEDLKKIAQIYNDQDEHEAPIVIGHPKSNRPAYGWVGELAYEDGTLFARIEDPAKIFMDWWRKGLYKKRSISLDPDLRLRHIGFLGAAAPAVKGMKDGEPLPPEEAFNEAEYSEDTTYFEFEDPSQREGEMTEEQIAQMLEAMAEIKKMIEAMVGAQGKPEEKPATEGDGNGDGGDSGFSEAETLRAENAKLREQNQELRFNEFLSSPDIAKRVPPVMRASVVAMMKALDKGAEGMSFSEGEKTPLDLYKDQITKWQPAVEFGEFATKGAADPSAIEDEDVRRGRELAKAGY